MVTLGPGTLEFVGIEGYSAFWNNGTSQSVATKTIEDTGPRTIKIWSDGYSQALEDFSGLFYSKSCHASCLSCSGVLPN